MLQQMNRFVAGKCIYSEVTFSSDTGPLTQTGVSLRWCVWGSVCGQGRPTPLGGHPPPEVGQSVATDLCQGRTCARIGAFESKYASELLK